MPKFESAPKMKRAELHPNEIGSHVGAEKASERGFAPEGLEGPATANGQERAAEKPLESAEEQIEEIDRDAVAKEEEIAHLTESIEGTRSALRAARDGLGLPQTEEDPPSVMPEKDRLETLRAEKGALDEQKEQLLSRREREMLIRAEKEKVLQEKLDELFKEFEGLGSLDFESILTSGKTLEGLNVESRSMGQLEPGAARSLAKAFKEGMRQLPKILEVMPDLLEKFDEDLTKEATERVDKKIEEEKQKLEEEQGRPKQDEESVPYVKSPKTPLSP